MYPHQDCFYRAQAEHKKRHGKRIHLHETKLKVNSIVKLQNLNLASQTSQNLGHVIHRRSKNKAIVRTRTYYAIGVIRRG